MGTIVIVMRGGLQLLHQVRAVIGNAFDLAKPKSSSSRTRTITDPSTVSIRDCGCYTRRISVP